MNKHFVTNESSRTESHKNFEDDIACRNMERQPFLCYPVYYGAVPQQNAPPPPISSNNYMHHHAMTQLNNEFTRPADMSPNHNSNFVHSSPNLYHNQYKLSSSYREPVPYNWNHLNNGCESSPPTYQNVMEPPMYYQDHPQTIHHSLENLNTNHFEPQIYNHFTPPPQTYHHSSPMHSQVDVPFTETPDFSRPPPPISSASVTLPVPLNYNHKSFYPNYQQLIELPRLLQECKIQNSMPQRPSRNFPSINKNLKPFKNTTRNGFGSHSYFESLTLAKPEIIKPDNNEYFKTTPPFVPKCRNEEIVQRIGEKFVEDKGCRNKFPTSRDENNRTLKRNGLKISNLELARKVCKLKSKEKVM